MISAIPAPFYTPVSQPFANISKPPNIRLLKTGDGGTNKTAKMSHLVTRFEIQNQSGMGIN